MKKFAAVIIFIGAVFVLMLLYSIQQGQESVLQPLPQVPAPGMVTMVNLGADSCLPCQMMEPIIEEMREKYEDQAKIAFIDIWKHSDQGQRFRITTIPAQIFYDHQGQEVFRHQGFMDAKSVASILDELLEKQTAAQPAQVSGI
ncbi:thioredoxin family protein [Desulfonatronovibrio hydrogenovorans]|uniref:thioredoxin family protein n=1 Tax=Desulfonatronovibrio hydrogenovorans TaxID=53245 RepID=UPI00048BBF89|nr:thioredoxin family protein [Desulfonatronovibrio hydrogenovorans]